MVKNLLIYDWARATQPLSHVRGRIDLLVIVGVRPKDSKTIR